MGTVRADRKACVLFHAHERFAAATCRCAVFVVFQRVHAAVYRQVALRRVERRAVYVAAYAVAALEPVYRRNVPSVA